MTRILPNAYTYLILLLLLIWGANSAMAQGKRKAGKSEEKFVRVEIEFHTLTAIGDKKDLNSVRVTHNMDGRKFRHPKPCNDGRPCEFLLAFGHDHQLKIEQENMVPVKLSMSTRFSNEGKDISKMKKRHESSFKIRVPMVYNRRELDLTSVSQPFNLIGFDSTNYVFVKYADEESRMIQSLREINRESFRFQKMGKPLAEFTSYQYMNVEEREDVNEMPMLPGYSKASDTSISAPSDSGWMADNRRAAEEPNANIAAGQRKELEKEAVLANQRAKQDLQQETREAYTKGRDQAVRRQQARSDIGQRSAKDAQSNTEELKLESYNQQVKKEQEQQETRENQAVKRSQSKELAAMANQEAIARKRAKSAASLPEGSPKVTDEERANGSATVRVTTLSYTDSQFEYKQIRIENQRTRYYQNGRPISEEVYWKDLSDFID